MVTGTGGAQQAEGRAGSQAVRHSSRSCCSYESDLIADLPNLNGTQSSSITEGDTVIQDIVPHQKATLGSVVME